MISRKQKKSEVKTRENQFKVALNQTGTFNIRNAIHTGSKERHFYGSPITGFQATTKVRFKTSKG